MSAIVHSANTPYGFEWGASTVTRIASLPDGSVVLSVLGTAGAGVDIRVSPAGRAVRVWEAKSGKELTAEEVVPITD